MPLEAPKELALYTFTLQTHKRTELIDITKPIAEMVKEKGLAEGAVMVFVPHTTAGCTINENADPDVRRDMLNEINKIIPFESGYTHSEGNSAAHIKASLFGSSCLAPIVDGKLDLGQWQGIYFAEFDGPRRRSVTVLFLTGA